MSRFRELLKPFYPIVRKQVHSVFYSDLHQHTREWSQLRWLGQPIQQPVLDLWTIQETICEIRPELVIETGTKYGGSALFYASLFDLLDHGKVITVDVEKQHELLHPRITFLLGSSVEARIVEQVVNASVGLAGPVMVILDSDHSTSHVSKELDAYHSLVTPGSYLHVQDGYYDRRGRMGPLRAILDFLPAHPEFEVDHERSERFLVTHHPKGWLRRKTDSSGR